MQEFGLYFRIGIDHITDLGGYDHMLFLVATCASLAWSEWRKLAWLVTAFTLGHSITLAMSVLSAPFFSSEWIEFFIPVTILLTAMDLLRSEGNSPQRLKYVAVATFGCIHGMGFSSYLRSLLGSENDLLLPLFGFNLGLEMGQLVVVTAVVAFTSILVGMIGIQRRDLRIFLAGAVGLAAFSLMLEKWPG